MDEPEGREVFEEDGPFWFARGSCFDAIWLFLLLLLGYVSALSACYIAMLSNSKARHFLLIRETGSNGRSKLPIQHKDCLNMS